MKFRISPENVLYMTEQLIREYYRLNTEPFFSVLSKDCIWILPGTQIAIGEEAIRGMFKGGFVMPPHRVEDARFEQVETGSPDQLAVYGVYTLLTDIRSKMVDASRQRVTFLYRRQDNGFRLYHLHVSHEWTELTGDEFFPVQVSRETYHYVQKLLSESGRSLRRRIAIEAEGITHFIDTDMVLYAEAIGKICTLNMLDRNVVVRQPLKLIEGRFPDCFCRIHRSYLVNCNYITRLERYSAVLLGGTALPIPEKRYHEVCERVARFIRGGADNG